MNFYVQKIPSLFKKIMFMTFVVSSYMSSKSYVAKAIIETQSHYTSIQFLPEEDNFLFFFFFTNLRI